MGRIAVEIDESLFHAAKAVLGTETKVATSNAALREMLRRKQIQDAITDMNNVEMDYSDSAAVFRYGGGRDLSQFGERARQYAEQLHAADQPPA